MIDQEKRIQEIIDDLKRKNLEYDEKEAYQEEFKRNVIIITALESLQRERKEPEPLTLEQLKHMNGLPVFCHIPSENPQWGIVNVDESVVHIRHGLLLFKYYHGQCNGGTWRAYATEPKGEHHD